jgi:hypothetical protein
MKGLPDFHQISTSEPNFPTEILKFQIQISVVFSTTNNVSKTVFSSKSIIKWLRYHQEKVEIRQFPVQIKYKKPLENFDFI